MTPEQRLSELLEIVPVSSNRGLLTHDWVTANVSLPIAESVYAVIISESPATAQRFAAGKGIDTRVPIWKTLATAVAAANAALAPYLVLLRDFEFVYKPQWQVEKYEVEPTLESVTLEMRKTFLEDRAVDALQTYREALAAMQVGDPEPTLGGE